MLKRQQHLLAQRGSTSPHGPILFIPSSSLMQQIIYLGYMTRTRPSGNIAVVFTKRGTFAVSCRWRRL